MIIEYRGQKKYERIKKTAISAANKPRRSVIRAHKHRSAQHGQQHLRGGDLSFFRFDFVSVIRFKSPRLIELIIVSLLFLFELTFSYKINNRISLISFNRSILESMQFEEYLSSLTYVMNADEVDVHRRN